MTPLTLGTQTGESAGGIDTYSISLTAGKKYVIEYSGPDMLSVWIGSVGQGNGKLRSCGAWATYMPPVGGAFVIQVSGKSPVGSFAFVSTTQAYTILVREWKFSDYWNSLTGRFKSKC